MQLPKIDYPIYEVQLLSQSNPIRFRPFLVKEQKIMLMAVEANDVDNTLKAIKQVIGNCVLDPINVDDLPLADIETLFINLRARSMGEILNLYFKCTNKVGSVGLEMSCNMVIEVPVDLLKVPQINGNISKKIMLSDTVGLMMKYPSLNSIKQLIDVGGSEVDSVINVMASCIETIYDGDNVYETKDSTAEEVLAFIENLPGDKFELLENFVTNLPKSRFESKQTCPKCKYEHNFVLEGLSDFFI